jgi:uncharacterized protein involved in exopolysaccharide biosynthesis
MWRRKWLLIVPVLASVVTSLLVVHFVPVRYASESTLVLVHAQIPADFVPQVASRTPEDMRRLTTQVLSRTRLERVITEYGLYTDDRKRGIMEEIVEGMRNDIQITAADDPQASGSKVLKVSFRSTDPRLAQKVTESLAGFIVNDSQNDQVNLTEGTVQFLQAQAEDTKRRLQAFESAHGPATRAESRTIAIEREVLEDTYRSLLAKQQEAKIVANLQARQYGEQIKILDSPRIPERPIGLTRTQLTVAGLASGLLVGFVVVGVSSRKPR